MKEGKSTGQIILSHTITYFNLLNLILFGLILLSGQYKNMFFMGIVVSNSLIGIIQELKVKKLIDALSVITATKAKLLVADGIREIPIEELQIDDTIQVAAGDQIVADCTVRTSEGMEVNESLLTGESVPVLKKPGDLLYSGSYIVAGSGTGQVLHTGEDNYATQLVKKARTKKRATSEMQDAIKRIIKYVSYAIIPIGITLFCIQYFRAGENLSDSLVNTVAGVLGMIPEGLVLLTSVSFILGVGRLARKKALVQEMEAIEALARVDVLCLDKTGTITTGKLTVNSILPLHDCSEEKICCFMDGLVFAFSETNATSEALQNFFHDTKPFPVTDTVPFSSQRKFMGVSFQGQGSFVLGAPEFLTREASVLQQAETCASQGLRVLLLASCQTLSTSPGGLAQVSPMALILLSDCIKEDAPETFHFFANQGVKVKIVSGDNPATVSTVGVQAGIDGAERFIDASTLPKDETALRKTVSQYTVFGRVSPEMKQAIIHACQAEGHVVGMVGDGVNDVLALKDSDCGIAMAKGADAAKQTAHIVLMDSDFASMKNIVKEGRTVIANIERVSALYLTKTIYSILLCVLFIIMGKPYPFIPIQLSLIGAAAIGIPSFLLALEHHEEVTSSGFLRHVLRFSLPGALSLCGVLLGIQFLAGPLHFSDALISTLNLLAGGIVSLGVVAFVCHPMTKRRMAICIGITILFVGAFFLFPEFFGILPVLKIMLYH
ncbi:MAG: HAD-IC family P-type ATPase [Lachnospiraceae bacterium]|nr:HAD-IC family P-type ATPase [Lachnospiraceae bacterium]